MDDQVIRRAVRTLLDAAPPNSWLILFGSQARGQARSDSDLDLLVIEPGAVDSFAEMVRLSKLLGDMLIPADVIVLSEAAFNKWRDTPNTLAYRALREGRVYERVA